MAKQKKTLHSEKPDPLVGIIMGSTSDLRVMQFAAETLRTLAIPFEERVVSAHRTPHLMVKYASGAADRGVRVLIAGAGGAAHLPGMVASLTPLPVLGVPVESSALAGLDSLLSIVQMPAGVPVGTLSLGKAGAINAALLAGRILAADNPEIAGNLEAWRQRHERSAVDSQTYRTQAVLVADEAVQSADPLEKQRARALQKLLKAAGTGPRKPLKKR